MPTPYSDLLGIQPPSLASVRDHPAAHTFACLIVVLLEHGASMTLRGAAERFAAAGIAVAGIAVAGIEASIEAGIAPGSSPASAVARRRT